MELTVLQKLKQEIQQSQILSADTKIIVSAFIFNSLENEKAQIFNSFNQGYRIGFADAQSVAENEKDISEYDDALNYFNQTFKND